MPPPVYERKLYIGTDLLTHTVTIYPFTWKDQSRLTTSSNVSFWSEERIEQFDQLLLETLLGGWAYFEFQGLY